MPNGGETVLHDEEPGANEEEDDGWDDEDEE